MDDGVPTSQRYHSSSQSKSLFVFSVIFSQFLNKTKPVTISIEYVVLGIPGDLEVLGD